MRPGQRRRTNIGGTSESLSLGRKHKPDYWLLIIATVLVSIGVVIVYSIGPALEATTKLSSSYYIIRQLIAIGLSIVAFIVMYNLPLKSLKDFYKPILAIAVLATILAIILPVNPAYPAHRWVRLGSLSFQSVELAKFAIIIWMASFFSATIKSGMIKNTTKMLKILLAIILAIGFFIAGVQSDLGSMAVIVAIITAMAFVSGLPLKIFGYFIVFLGLALIVAVTAFPYRMARLETFLHPQAQCQASGYQACQALIAEGSGGFYGLGLGKSVQAYGYEPEANNDSIFAIYAETFGFIGCVALLGLFVALFARIKNISLKSTDSFSRLLVVGVLAWLTTQTIINIGAMIGLLPLKGITLPLISYGGTSIVFIAAALGVVFQISRYTSYQVSSTDKNIRREGHENRLNGRRIRGAYHPDSGNRSSN